VVENNINGVAHGETLSIAGHQDVPTLRLSMLIMQVASKIKEEELFQSILEIT